MTETEFQTLHDQAADGQISWVALAIREKAYLGLVTYATYTRMTPEERVRVGHMNQSTARRHLGLR